MFRCAAVLLLLGVLPLTAAPTQGDDRPAPAKWADAGLSVTDGLELWFDAGRLNAARKANGEKDIADGDKVEIWYDASSHARNLTQKDAAARPTFLAADATPALLFDGDGAYLSLTGAGLLLQGGDGDRRGRPLPQPRRLPRLRGDEPAR